MKHGVEPPYYIYMCVHIYGEYTYGENMYGEYIYVVNTQSAKNCSL